MDDKVKMRVDANRS